MGRYNRNDSPTERENDSKDEKSDRENWLKWGFTSEEDEEEEGLQNMKGNKNKDFHKNMWFALTTVQELLFRNYVAHDLNDISLKQTSFLVLYCIDGVVIAAQCAATFLRSIVLPEFRY